MATLNYSKKQIQPLIDKYAINAETNTTFIRLIEMFDGRPNYQLWAVKVVFSRAIQMDALEVINEWANNNPSLIKRLSKNGNITSYTKPGDFKRLAVEMEGLEAISFVQHMINCFNTEQRHMLSKAIIKEDLNGVNWKDNGEFMNWLDIFKKFNRLSGNTKEKVIGRMSAVKNLENIRQLLIDSLKEGYQWNKEDLLAFVANNAPNCAVVINDKNVVVLQVKSYKDSKTLCYGRTNWCITSSESNWNSYVISTGGKQFFLFDFSKNEKDELAHIGFTVVGNKGFYAAHSTTDQNMMGDGFHYNGKRMNITNALKNLNLTLSNFLTIEENNNFKWDMESLVKFISDKKDKYTVAYEKDNRIIVCPLTLDGMRELIKNTYIKPLDVGSHCRSYLLFDFNLKQNDEHSIINAFYTKDNYGFESLNSMTNAFGINVSKDYLKKVGIDEKDFFNREKISPDVILHKLIDEKKDNEASKLIDDEKDINVNFVFRDRVPIFSAIENGLFKTVGKIISNKGFDANVDGGYDESILQIMLFNFYLDDTVALTKEREEGVREMINSIVDSNKFDINYVDGNLDTAINIACMDKSMNWLVKKLAANPDVEINQVNDIGFTAFGNAIRCRNFEAAKILGQRPDLKVQDIDRKVAKKVGFDIDACIKPKPFAKVTKSKVLKADASDIDKYSEAFMKVFAKV